MQHDQPVAFDRRRFITRAMLAGGAFAMGLPALADPVDHARDWQWLVGNWDVYHRNLGEVHCGTNVSRRLDARWWESGR